jgi:hypothetical protein
MSHSHLASMLCLLFWLWLSVLERKGKNFLKEETCKRNMLTCCMFRHVVLGVCCCRLFQMMCKICICSYVNLYNCPFFNVSLTVHLSITLTNNQLNAQIFNTFITIQYMYIAISCSFSGGQIVLIQHLVSSLTESDDTRSCINTIWPPEDEQNIAQNMYM